MATFQVPQFIEEKSKIIGPLTLHQFFYLAAAGAVSFVSFYIFNFFLWIFITALVGALGVAFAFVKIEGQSFPALLLSAFRYLWQPRTYTWQRQFTEGALDTSAFERLEKERERMHFQEKIKSLKLFLATHRAFSPKQAKEAKKRYETIRHVAGDVEKVRRVDY